MAVDPERGQDAPEPDLSQRPDLRLVPPPFEPRLVIHDSTLERADALSDQGVPGWVIQATLDPHSRIYGVSVREERDDLRVNHGRVQRPVEAAPPSRWTRIKTFCRDLIEAMAKGEIDGTSRYF